MPRRCPALWFGYRGHSRCSLVHGHSPPLCPTIIHFQFFHSLFPFESFSFISFSIPPPLSLPIPDCQADFVYRRDPTDAGNAWIKATYSACGRPNLTVPSGLGNCPSSPVTAPRLDELTLYLKNADQSSSLSGDQICNLLHDWWFYGRFRSRLHVQQQPLAVGKYYAADDT